MSTGDALKPLRRRPKLKVVGGEARKRHLCSWLVPGPTPSLNLYARMEFWSEAEYAAMPEWERAGAIVNWLPGIGYIRFDWVDLEDMKEINENLRAEQDYARSGEPAKVDRPPPL